MNRLIHVFIRGSSLLTRNQNLRIEAHLLIVSQSTSRAAASSEISNLIHGGEHHSIVCSVGRVARGSLEVRITRFKQPEHE